MLPTAVLAAAPAASTAAGATPATPPVPAILAIQVVFENAPTANFTHADALSHANDDFLSQIVVLAVPVENYVLQQNVSNSYRYHVDQITAHSTLTGPWVTDSKDTIYPSVN